MRGLERRIEAGLRPDVCSVASVFVSRWDKAVMGKVPEDLRGQLGIAIAKQTYRSYRELLDSPRWERLENAGARPQRLLWASTGTKDPQASDVLYIEALAAPSRSTRCPRRRCTPSPITARSARPCRATAATPSRCSRGSRRRASTTTRSPRSSRRRAPTRSSSRGTTCCRVIAAKSESAAQGGMIRMTSHAGAPLTERPAWKALADPSWRGPRPAPAAALRRRSRTRATRFTREAVGLYVDYSKHRITDETLRLLLALAEECGLRARIDAMFRGEKINVTEEPRRPARRAARAARRAHRRRRRGRRARGARRARPHGGLRRPGAQRRVDRTHRQAHPQRDQHRHRRLRPRSGDGLRGAAPLRAARPDAALRLQRRRHRLRRGDARPRRGGDAVHRLLEDLHHAGDDDQRADGARAGAWPRCATRRRSRSTSSPSRPTRRR